MEQTQIVVERGQAVYLPASAVPLVTGSPLADGKAGELETSCKEKTILLLVPLLTSDNTLLQKLSVKARFMLKQQREATVNAMMEKQGPEAELGKAMVAWAKT